MLHLIASVCFKQRKKPGMQSKFDFLRTDIMTKFGDDIKAGYVPKKQVSRMNALFHVQ